MPATLRQELARKAIHVASAVVPAAYAAGLPRAVLLALLAAAGVVAAGLEVARRRSARVRGAFVGLVGPMLRAHEHDRWSGATWMVAAYALAVLLFPRPVAVAAMLGVALGDAAAAVVGRWAAGRRASAPPRAGAAVAAPGAKTWAGSAACAGATLAGALLVAGLAPRPAVACALAAALAERPRGPFDDNVRIALAAGVAALLAHG